MSRPRPGNPMPGVRITVDGLWRCLCPSIDTAVLTRVVSAPYRPQLTGKQKLPCATLRAKHPARYIHTTLRRSKDEDEPEEESSSLAVDEDVTAEQNVSHGAVGTGDEAESLADRTVGPDMEGKEDGASDTKPAFDCSQQDATPDTGSGASSDDDLPADPNQAILYSEASSTVDSPPQFEGLKDSVPLAINPCDPPPRYDKFDKLAGETYDSTKVSRLVQIIRMKKPFTRVPHSVTTDDIYAALRITRDRRKAKWLKITFTLVKYLLANGTPPNTFIYETLIMAQVHRDGSADAVRSLLQEMRNKAISWSSVLYHSALRVLTVHPDYLLRNDILREMKERWVELTDEGHQYVATGLLRDEQYELAFEQLQNMIKTNVKIEPWVFDIFIYNFAKLGFTDDAVRIARHKEEQDIGNVSDNIWYYLLDMCSQAQSYESTAYLWNRTVKQGILNPSDGVALNVLNMAAVYGDADLASEVIQYISDRGTRLGRAHYEALADAYCVQSNIKKAIEVYCIMEAAGVEVTQQTAGPICQALSRQPRLLEEAVRLITVISRERVLPIGVFNAVLNEVVSSQVHEPDEAFANAMELYQKVRELVPKGPDWVTFRNLLWKCTRPDVAQFLAREMVIFKIPPNLVILDAMFKVHVAHNGPTYRAKEYFFNIAPYFMTKKKYKQGSRRWRAIMDLSIKLIKRLIARRDSEAWRILDICMKNGLKEEEIKALREEVEAGTIWTSEAADDHDLDGMETETQSAEDRRPI